jgi:hypothetical protein
VTEPVEVAIAEKLFSYLTNPELTGMSSATRAKPFVAYMPTAGTAYMEVHPLLLAESEHFGVDDANPNLLSGIFQVDAVVPDNAAQNPGLRLANLIQGRFPLGLRLSVVSTLGTLTLRVTKIPTIAAAVKDAPWVRFPVSIPYLVITN